MFNTDVITNFSLGAAATVPIIVAIVQAFKLTQWVKDRYAPLLSICIGVLVAWLLSNHTATNYTLGGVILTGILFGLSASGLYSGIQTTAEAIKMDRIRAINKDKNPNNKSKG
jgi:Na+-translocating ferredoxin:NAD+ oxidoreductase RnfD subunit